MDPEGNRKPEQKPDPAQESELKLQTDETISLSPEEQKRQTKLAEFPLIGETRGGGLVQVLDGIGSGKFGKVYVVKIDPLAIYRDQVLEGIRDPSFYGITEAKKEGERWVLTDEQKSRVRAVFSERLALSEKTKRKTSQTSKEEIDTARFALEYLDSRFRLREGKCAAKFLNNELLKDPVAMGRFEREFTITRDRLEHPNIVRTIAFHKSEKEAFIVMEYIPDAKQLDDIMAEITVEQTTHLMQQTLSAVAHAHERGVIHRDIKPGNILVNVTYDDHGNKRITAHLTDYGIAKMMQKDTSSGTMTGTGEQYLGTPFWMSPEQARGEAKTLDEKTDVYSIGSTFYQVYTGAFPFVSESIPGVLGKIASGQEPAFIRSIDPELSPELEDLLIMMMAPEKENRLTARLALAEAEKIIKQKRYTPVSAGTSGNNVKPLRKEIRAIEKRPELTEDDYLELGRKYAELAEASPRFEAIPRPLKKYSVRIKKLRQGSSATKSLDLKALLGELGIAITRHARKAHTRQHYFELASECFGKAQPDEGLVGSFKPESEWTEAENKQDLYWKKALAEKRRIKQMIERTEEKPPGLISRVLSHPATWIVAPAVIAVGAIVSYIGITRTIEESFNQEQLESAKDLERQAQEFFGAGDLQQAKGTIEAAYQAYDQIEKKDYDEDFEEGIEEFQDMIKRSMADVERERRMIADLARIDSLIQEQKVETAKDILDNAEGTLKDFLTTPYAPLREKVSHYEDIVENHREKIDDKEIDIEDLKLAAATLQEIKKEVDEKLEGLASEDPEFFTQKDLDALKNKINRFSSRVKYDVIRENVNPQSYDQISLGYLRADNYLYSKLMVRAVKRHYGLIDDTFADLEKILSDIEKDYAASDSTAKIELAGRKASSITARKKHIEELNLGSLSPNYLSTYGYKFDQEDPDNQKTLQKIKDEIAELNKEKDSVVLLDTLDEYGRKEKRMDVLEDRLAKMTARYNKARQEVSRFSELKRKAEEKDEEAALTLGKYHLDREEYARAEPYFRIAEGKEQVKQYLEIIALEKMIRDPKNLTYRVLGTGYSSDDLAGLQAAIRSYKEGPRLGEGLISMLRSASEKTGADIDIDELKRKHDEYAAAIEERAALEKAEEKTEEVKEQLEETDSRIAGLQKDILAVMEDAYKSAKDQLEKAEPRPDPDSLQKLGGLYKAIGKQEKAEKIYSMIQGS